MLSGQPLWSVFKTYVYLIIRRNDYEKYVSRAVVTGFRTGKHRVRRARLLSVRLLLPGHGALLPVSA